MEDIKLALWRNRNSEVNVGIEDVTNFQNIVFTGCEQKCKYSPVIWH